MKKSHVNPLKLCLSCQVTLVLGPCKQALILQNEIATVAKCISNYKEFVEQFFL